MSPIAGPRRFLKIFFGRGTAIALSTIPRRKRRSRRLQRKRPMTKMASTATTRIMLLLHFFGVDLLKTVGGCGIVRDYVVLGGFTLFYIDWSPVEGGGRGGCVVRYGHVFFWGGWGRERCILLKVICVRFMPLRKVSRMCGSNYTTSPCFRVFFDTAWHAWG